MAHLLLVEDDPRVAAFVVQGLTEDAHLVDHAATVEDALARVHHDSYDVVLLDLRLPDGSGLDVCREIRRISAHLPILMLTALDAVEDRVAGLRAGADDYLPKPFAFEELVARIEALLRRSRLVQPPVALKDGRSLALDPETHTATVRGRPLDLSPTEFALLAFFVARAGQVLRRDDLHRGVWGHDFDRGTNLVEVYVGYVRRKLVTAGADGGIETIRGVGYRYVADLYGAA